MPTSKLYEQLELHPEWGSFRHHLFKQAKQNGEYVPGKITIEVSQKQNNSNSKNTKKVYMGSPALRGAAQLFVRMLATLEMIMKDPHADIAVRKGSKKDFVAALKLFEQVTLPLYFGLYFREPLFDDYEDIKPIIPWEYLED